VEISVTDVYVKNVNANTAQVYNAPMNIVGFAPSQSFFSARGTLVPQRLQGNITVEGGPKFMTDPASSARFQIAGNFNTQGWTAQAAMGKTDFSGTVNSAGNITTYVTGSPVQ